MASSTWHFWRTNVARALAVPLLLAGASACSGVGGYALRTGDVAYARHDGPVAIYASGKIPEGAEDLGVVEVLGSGDNGDIQELFPEFVRKVASIGGNCAVIAATTAEFAYMTSMVTSSYTHPCGFRGRCTSFRTYPVTREVMTVRMRGYAYRSAP